MPRDAWAFARREDSKVIPDPTSLYVKDGLKPGWLYDLVYTARDPRVSGLGLAGLRDAISFFRYAEKDNPMRDAIDRAYIFGISQSGRVCHHFLYEGLNRDVADRCVFDGALIHVPGGGKLTFNYRFGMATAYGVCHRGNLYGSEYFPFTPGVQADPVTGKTGDSLARLRAKGEIPKIMFVQTSTEYWSRAASLLHTDVEGKKDLTLDPNVRVYLIAGTQHLGAGSGNGICQNPRNPVKHRGPVLRALLTALDGWGHEGRGTARKSLSSHRRWNACQSSGIPETVFPRFRIPTCRKITIDLCVSNAVRGGKANASRPSSRRRSGPPIKR